MIALAPKCYTISTEQPSVNSTDTRSSRDKKEIIKIKGLSSDNGIHYNDYKDGIDNDTTKSGVNHLIKCEGNQLLIIKQQKPSLTGFHNKMVVFPNQSAAPFIQNLTSIDYSIV